MNISGDKLQFSDGGKMVEEEIRPTPDFFKKYDGWSIEPFEFTGVRGEKADGCKFILNAAEKGKENNSIFIVRNKTDTKFQETIIEGSGWWLGQSPKGDVVVYEINEEQHGIPVEWQGEGWINTWIAKSEGAVVVDITEPRFVPNVTEEEIDVNDPAVTPEFRDEYNLLKSLHE